MNRIIRAVERASTWSGKAFAWLVIALMLVVCVEVFKRYVLNRPTAGIFDLSNWPGMTLWLPRFLYGG